MWFCCRYLSKLFILKFVKWCELWIYGSLVVKEIVGSLVVSFCNENILGGVFVICIVMFDVKVRELYYKVKISNIYFIIGYFVLLFFFFLKL